MELVWVWSAVNITQMGVVSSEYNDKWVWSAVNITTNGCGQ